MTHDDFLASASDSTAPRKSLTPAIRSSLQAKLERLLARPIIATILDVGTTVDHLDDDDSTDVFRAIEHATRNHKPTAGRAEKADVWTESPEDGSQTVKIYFDYDKQWRGCEKEILEAVKNTIESPVTYLTNAQKRLLETSPREFLALTPRPESADLVAYKTDMVGGSERVIELTVDAPPVSPSHVHHIAIVPNLVQIERQLDAVDELEKAADDGPLAPLRALVGLCDAPGLLTQTGTADTASLDTRLPDERLDEFQAECIRKAMSTPHFAVIQGPPGSGKTTVITSVIRQTVFQGGRVLVVSPTHVAVDNVIEKLVPRMDRLANDRLEPHTLPVRYAARKGKLSELALEYWVGSKGQLRGATIARRVQARLSEVVQLADSLYAKEDENATGNALISSGVAAVESVVCGTPIGILSYSPVKEAAPGEFDLLIVDEVSKMTLPEFLAIAVKAKRWVLVGDPEQLPPFNNAEENAPTLDEVLNPLLELVCSVGAILERAQPHERRAERLVVVSTDPTRVISAIRAHLAAVSLDQAPHVAALDEGTDAGIIVCLQQEVGEACAALAATRGRDRTHNANYEGTVRVLVERGLRPLLPEAANGASLVVPRLRAQSLIFENSFSIYHVQPWSERSNQKLRVLGFRNGLEKYLPSTAAISALDIVSDGSSIATTRRDALIRDIAERFAINTVSVYDWLTGISIQHYDKSPLVELGMLPPVELCASVRPFVGTLKKQYRMHASLSRVPRELFYFGEALLDGKSASQSGCRVNLVQVEADDDGESNAREVQTICDMLTKLNATDTARTKRPEIMVITPYRKQESLLNEAIVALRERGDVANLDVDICTLDRCQGREAEFVFISLVRRQATVFFDMPKRWNVALTRAKHGLFVVGNIDAYLSEVAQARRTARPRPPGKGQTTGGPLRPQMSLLARIIEAYSRQIAEHQRGPR